MKKLLKSRKGSASLLFFGLLFLLLLLTFLIIEMGATIENYDYAMDVLQRCCNSAVERNILDEYRADCVLKMNASGAERDFRNYVRADLSSRYTVSIDSVQCVEMPPKMTVTGKVRFSTLFSQYGFEDVTYTFKVRSTNYDLD